MGGRSWRAGLEQSSTPLLPWDPMIPPTPVVTSTLVLPYSLTSPHLYTARMYLKGCLEYFQVSSSL